MHQPADNPGSWFTIGHLKLLRRHLTTFDLGALEPDQLGLEDICTTAQLERLAKIYLGIAFVFHSLNINSAADAEKSIVTAKQSVLDVTNQLLRLQQYVQFGSANVVCDPSALTTTAEDFPSVTVASMLQAVRQAAKDVGVDNQFEYVRKFILRPVSTKKDSSSTDSTATEDLLPACFVEFSNINVLRRFCKGIMNSVKEIHTLQMIAIGLRSDNPQLATIRKSAITALSKLASKPLNRSSSIPWSAAHDLCLILGSLRHGFMQYADMSADAPLESFFTSLSLLVSDATRAASERDSAAVGAAASSPSSTTPRDTSKRGGIPDALWETLGDKMLALEAADPDDPVSQPLPPDLGEHQFDGSEDPSLNKKTPAITWLLSEQVSMPCVFSFVFSAHICPTQKKVFTARLRLIVKYVGSISAMHTLQHAIGVGNFALIAIPTPQGIRYNKRASHESKCRQAQSSEFFAAMQPLACCRKKNVARKIDGHRITQVK